MTCMVGGWRYSTCPARSSGIRCRFCVPTTHKHPTSEISIIAAYPEDEALGIRNLSQPTYGRGTESILRRSCITRVLILRAHVDTPQPLKVLQPINDTYFFDNLTTTLKSPRQSIEGNSIVDEDLERQQSPEISSSLPEPLPTESPAAAVPQEPKTIRDDPNARLATPETCVDYLIRLANEPYQTTVLTHQINGLEERCDVSWLSVSDDVDRPRNLSVLIDDLDSLISVIAQTTEEGTQACSFLVVRDPAPAVIAALGTALDIPFEFFASHASSARTIHVEDKVISPIIREQFWAPQKNINTNLAEQDFGCLIRLTS